ncbi:hypothetical protein GS875_06425 [Rhodococcus hoagii]|nr:hypothetical protein [Prescottella equi]
MSFAFVFVGLVIAATLMLIVGWLALPWYLRALRWWPGRRDSGPADMPGRWWGSGTRRYRTGRASTTCGRLIVAPSTRRDFAWVAVHSIAALTAGLLAIALPLAALNTLAIPFYWWALPPDEPVSSIYPGTSWWGAAPMPLFAVGYAYWPGGRSP